MNTKVNKGPTILVTVPSLVSNAKIEELQQEEVMEVEMEVDGSNDAGISCQEQGEPTEDTHSPSLT